MKHCIIVKWNDSVTDKQALLHEVDALFADTTSLPGITGTAIVPNCIDRPNRYDLMIVLSMDRDYLPVWDDSNVHKLWKDKYGSYILSKAIFDYE